MNTALKPRKDKIDIRRKFCLKNCEWHKKATRDEWRWEQSIDWRLSTWQRTKNCLRTKKIEFCVSYSMFPETRSLFERILAKCRKTKPELEITFRLWMNVVTTEWEIALSSFTAARDNAPLFSHFSKTIHKKMFPWCPIYLFFCAVSISFSFSSVLDTKCLCLGLFISEYLPFCVWQCEKQYKEREFYLFPWKNASRMQFLLALFPAFVSSSFTIGT